MEIISEVVYWAVLLYTPIYWFIGLIVLGGCFIAGTIWSTLACSFRPQTPGCPQDQATWESWTTFFDGAGGKILK